MGQIKVRIRRISPVAAHSGDRLLSEPTAGTQPCRREPLFMQLSGTLLYQPLRWACLVAEYPDKGNPRVELFIRRSYLDGKHRCTLLAALRHAARAN